MVRPRIKGGPGGRGAEVEEPEEKQMEAPVDEHQPINFGKRLAHTDKLVRDRGFRTLKKWLTKHPDLQRLDFMKLWKGLYFGIWMADKRPVQQELAVNIALLLNDVPRDKQAMWIDCFWETMQTAWEKLDIHRISKYLLVIRIVIAESFKTMRLAGWPLEEMRSLGNSFTRAMPMKAKDGPNAPSLGLILQFTRVFWDELRPQLEAGSTPKKALLEFLEPFHVLAEGSPVDALVRHVHQHIFRKAPQELLESLAARILEGAARPEVNKKNREALYDTADVLEKLARSQGPAPKGVKPLCIVGDDGKVVKAASPKLSSLPPLELPESASPVQAEQTKKMKKGKKRKAKKTNGESKACMSPLMLPAAAVCVEGASTPQRKLKKKRRGSDPVAGAEGSTSAVRPKKKKRAL